MKSSIPMLLLTGSLLTGPSYAHPHESELEGPAHDVEHAAALYLDGNAEAAVPLLESSIRSIEAAEGPENQALVTPLGFLGASYYRLERHEEALAALARARSIARAHEGEHNRTQLPLVYVEAESLKALGRLEAAEERQREAFELVRRHHGEDSMEAALALGRLAEWLAGLGRHDESLILFSRAIEKAERAADGSDEVAMLPLLQGMAVVLLADGRTPDRSLGLVRRMVALTDAHDGFDARARIDGRLLLGDLLMRFSREKDAVKSYEEAWRIAHEAGDARQLEKLAKPSKVAGRLEPVDAIPADGDFFVFRYDLRADGRPSHVELVDSNASAMVDSWAKARFREMRFRPPFIDGRARPVKDASGVFVH